MTRCCIACPSTVADRMFVNLRFQECAQTWDNGKCYTDRTATCGPSTGGSQHAIPGELLGSLEVCSECLTNGECTCTTRPAGDGLASTDFLLFVSSVPSRACNDSLIAYAATCQRDQWDRPTVGYANFCRQALSSDESVRGEQLSTAVHELLHALGFSRDSWPLFREDDGVTPRTPRDPSDPLDRPPVVPYGCVDGSTTNIRAPSSDTLRIGTERGLRVNWLVTTRVVAVARDIFGCDSVGAPPGPSTSPVPRL